MKLFIRLFLAAVLTVNAPALCLAQGKASAGEYYGVPVGQQTTKLSAVLPYYKEITVSKQFVDKQKAADPVRHELNQIDGKIQRLEMEKQTRQHRQQLLERAAPQDNTRVARPFIPERVINKSKGFNQALQQSKQSQEEKEIAALKKRRAELTKKLNASGVSREPGDANFKKLGAQAKINEAYKLYKQSANLPDFNKSPKQVQALITSELKSINSRLQHGPAYKSFISLQKAVNKINKNKRDDAILMSIFTLVALRKFNGVAISAPSSALAWWSLPRMGYYAKKAANFLAVLMVYAAIDQANLNAVNASFEEMVTRFTALENNMAFLQKIIRDGEKTVFGELKKPIPSAWSKNPDDAEHQTALRRLYGLRFINVYLQNSTVHYKFDLAMLDLFNLFSDAQNIVFDLSVFEQYEIQEGELVKIPGQTNTVNINASASLVERTGAKGRPSRIIQNLSKLPAFVYYKKTYYKNVGTKDKPIMKAVNPGGIIRTKDGILMDCNFDTGNVKTSRSGETRGNNMEFILDGDYYMRIEPVASVHNEGYRDKPKTYVFEDINTKDHTCKGNSVGIWA